MNIRVTEKVQSHHTNNGYKVVVVEFGEQDNNIRYYIGKKLFDWVPTDEEILKLNKIMIDLSPTFKQKLECLIKPLGGFM